MEAKSLKRSSRSSSVSSSGSRSSKSDKPLKERFRMAELLTENVSWKRGKQRNSRHRS